MKFTQINVSLFLVISLFSTEILAESVPVPAPPAIGARSYILQEINSGRVLAEHEPDKRVEPASITKVMTAYVVFNAIRSGRIELDDVAPISVKAWRNPGVSGWTKSSRMFADVNSKVAVSDLLRGLIIQSGNDAAIALAEYVAGSEEAFVDLMNETAKKLGLENTFYRNCTGWPAEGHYMSARDIAILSRALIREFPEMYRLYSEKRFTYNNISQSNRNSLLWKDEGADGIKTGYTESAGYCLVGSSRRDGMRLVSVVMGAPNADARVKYSQSLMNYGFRFFETHHLFKAGASLKETRIWKGDAKFLEIGLSEDLYITIPRGQYQNLKSILNVRKSPVAPVEAAEEVGRLDVYLDDKVIQEEPLIAIKPVARGNFLQRVFDQIAYLFQ